MEGKANEGRDFGTVCPAHLVIKYILFMEKRTQRL